MPSIVWKGHLTFGLVSIPVKLFLAARRERVRMHYVHRSEPAEPAELSEPPAPSYIPEQPRASGRFDPAPLESAPDAPPPPPPPAPVTRVHQSLVAGANGEPINRSEALRGY